MRNLSREQLLAELLALKPELERRGITHASLIGSRARLDNRPDSDIDLVIDYDRSRKFSLLDLIGAGHVIEDRVGLPADLITRSGLKDSFLRTTARDEVRVF